MSETLSVKLQAAKTTLNVEFASCKGGPGKGTKIMRLMTF